MPQTVIKHRFMTIKFVVAVALSVSVSTYSISITSLSLSNLDGQPLYYHADHIEQLTRLDLFSFMVEIRTVFLFNVKLKILTSILDTPEVFCNIAAHFYFFMLSVPLQFQPLFLNNE